MSLQGFLETRHLKRARLGPPDFYPQEPKQKEDELTSVNVKQGFIDHPPISDEHASAHLYTVDANKIEQSFNNILTKKQVFNTFNDDGKKRPQVSKDSFFVPRKPKLQQWFKDLGGSTQLYHFCKCVPVMNKKEEIFQMLAENETPLVRAAWFIKMTATYQIFQTEVKSKKRSTNDPNLEWTQAICRFLKEQLAKLNEENSEIYSGNFNPAIFSNPTIEVNSINGQISIPRDDFEQQLRYISCLAFHMYTEGLLDRHDFLTWVVETFEAIPLYDAIALNYYKPFLLQYTKDISMNLLLSRRMSFTAARHLNWIFLDPNSSRSGTPTTPTTGRNTPANQNAAQNAINNLNPTQDHLKQTCPESLLSIVHSLSCIIQVTTLDCTGSLVWYPPADPRSCGSPLDLLPCAPSSLLLPDLAKDDLAAVAERDLLINTLKKRECEVVRRSLAVETHWSSDKCQESTTGNTINRVLQSLEALDKQNFDRGDPLDSLYHKIFDPINTKESGEVQMSKVCEEAVIGLLCEWAITSKRLGEHRAAVVAKLLDLRQAQYKQELLPNNVTNVSQTSLNASSSSQLDSTANMDTTLQEQQQQRTPADNTPYFQSLLVSFLDSQAPELKDPDDPNQLQAFKNLIMLFTELIEHDVFSHTQYVNVLISRGDITPGQIHVLPIYNPITPQTDSTLDTSSSNSMSNSVPSKHLESGIKMELDEDDPLSVRSSHEVKIELDFLKSSGSVFDPDTKSDRHFLDAVRSVDANTKSKGSSNAQGYNSRMCGPIWGYNQPRHVQYVTHFPIPFQDEPLTHQWNQRLMVLYGAGKQKSEIKQAVRKVTRHLVKLVQSKREIDDKTDSIPTPPVWSKQEAPGGSRKSKKSNKSSSSHSELLLRFRALSYFDQHMVTSNVAKSLLDALNNYISGRPMLPRLDVVTLLFDLMEEALNVGGLIQLAVNITRLLEPLAQAINKRKAESESHGSFLQPGHVWYATELSLVVVSVLRHYQSYLTLDTDLAVDAFEGFLPIINRPCIRNPSQCTSADRGILVFMYDLYTSFGYIRAQHLDTFGNYVATVKQTLFSNKRPSTSNCRYEKEFLRSFIENPSAESVLSVAEKYSGQLHDTTFRYSFVCSAIITVCNGQQDFDRVNALASLCAEMNIRCSELSAEWLGVLKALCCSSSAANFNDVQMAVEARDSHIRDPLALFTAVLIARGCLSLEDVIQHVAIPSLLAACLNSKSTLTPDTGARLTCHLLLQLFKVPSSSTSSSFRLPSSSDRHLLAAAQHNIAVGAVLAVLKAMLKLGDAGFSVSKSSYKNDGESVASFFAPIQDMDIPMANVLDPGSRMTGGSSSMDGTSLSAFAKHAVHVICSQQWVREKCLQQWVRERNPQKKVTPSTGDPKDPVMDLLMDQVLTREQRQNLIQLICYPEEDLPHLSALIGDPRRYVVSILSGMTRWTLRQCLLELLVMLKQEKFPQEKCLPEHIAKATIEVFQQQQQQQLMESSRERKSSSTGAELDRCNVWLVAPLVGKLSSQVQSRVLQEASAILEAPQNWATSSTRSGASVRAERNENKQACSLLLNHQPFLTLILTCLKGQDEQRDTLLDSLQSQIIMLHTEWQSAHTQRDNSKDLPYLNTYQGVHEALQLRLSLVGGMFDTVQSNSQWTSTVVVLLTQLINSGMVDVQVNAELFDIVFDMIAILLHHTLGGDSPSKTEGSKREYMNIVKKMKKEMGERQTESIRRLRQLLPIPRSEVYVVCCEPSGQLIDVKGSKVPVPVDSTQGLQVASRQKLNAWEIIEGLKQPAPLCFTWFGAHKIERKVLPYEEQHALLRYHQHGNDNLRKEFLQPPKLPPEEEEEEIPPPRSIANQKIPKLSGPGSTTTLDTKRPTKKPKRPKPKTPKIESQLVPPFRNPPQMHSSGTQQSMPGSLPIAASPNYNYQMPSQNQYTYQQGRQQQPPQMIQNFPSNFHKNPSMGSGSKTGNARTHLAAFIKTKKPTNNRFPAMASGQPSGGNYNLNQDIRNKLEGRMKTGHMPSNPYGGQQQQQHQQRPGMGMPQMVGQQGNFNTYTNNVPSNMTQQQQPAQQQMPARNNFNQTVYRDAAGASGQTSYRSNVTSTPVNQQFAAQQTQQQPGGNSFVGNMPMQNTPYGNQQQNMGMMGMQGQNQPQQANQYTINQMQNHPAHISRMPPPQVQMTGANMGGGRIHPMSGGNTMPPSGGALNQGQMMQQHPQMMNQQPQYNQMQGNAPMMEIRRNHMQQGAPPQY